MFIIEYHLFAVMAIAAVKKLTITKQETGYSGGQKFTTVYRIMNKRILI